MPDDGEDVTETQAPEGDEEMDEGAADGDGAPDSGGLVEDELPDAADAADAAPVQAQDGEDAAQDEAAPSGPQGVAGGTEAAELAGVCGHSQGRTMCADGGLRLDAFALHSALTSASIRLSSA